MSASCDGNGDTTPAPNAEHEIVFTRGYDLDSETGGEIYVMRADGTGERRLTSNSFTDVDPDWSPDGSRIVFMSNRDGRCQLYTMNADGTDQRRLTSSSTDDTFPDWRHN